MRVGAKHLRAGSKSPKNSVESSVEREEKEERAQSVRIGEVGGALGASEAS